MVEQVSIDTSGEGEVSLEEHAAALDKANETDLADVPAKFINSNGQVDVSALAKSYLELEKNQGGASGKPDDKEAPAKEEQEAASDDKEDEAASDQEEAARETVENAGLDFDALSAKYAENGELTEEDYKSLEDANIPRSLVDAFIQGQEALQARAEGAVFESVGGKEAYDTMIAWAAENLSEEEITAYNTAVESGEGSQTKFAVSGLKARYDAAHSQDPARRLSGKASGGQEVYSSAQEFIRDTQNPLYRSDPGFRQKAIDKLARSNIPGF